QNGQGEQQLAARKYPDHFSFNAAPAWSPDGSLLACVVLSSDDKGFLARLTGIKVANRAESSLSKERWLDIEQVDWLRDGTGLVLAAQHESSAFQLLWHLSFPQQQTHRITNDLSDYRGVSMPVNPSVFLSIQQQTLTSIWMAPKGEFDRARQITSGAGRFFDLSWTADGKILYASDASGSADIWEMNADGSDQKQLTAGVGRNYAPVASPDGRYVVLHSNRSGNWQIWRMDRDGSNAVQLTSGNDESNWPAISIDGRWVFYQHTTGGAAMIWKLPIAGGTPVQINTTLSMRPALSPDGKLVAYW